ERHSYGDVEAATDHRQAKLFTGCGGDAHAGVATDALTRLVNDLRMGVILRETAALPGEMVHVHLVLGGQGADQAAVLLATATAQAAASFACGVLLRKSLLHFIETRDAPLHGDLRVAHTRGAFDGAEDGRPLRVIYRLHGDAAYGRFASHRLSGQVLVDGRRSDSARRDRTHCQVRPQHRIAAGEHTGQVGGHRLVSGPNAPGGDEQSFPFG